jgi:hypothetical protein
MLRCRWSPIFNLFNQSSAFQLLPLLDSRIPGNFFPDTPTMLKSPTLPRRRRSNSVRPTTPTFLSEPEAPPPTNPVVYSPVPTYILLACESNAGRHQTYHQNSRRGHDVCEYMGIEFREMSGEKELKKIERRPPGQETGVFSCWR